MKSFEEIMREKQQKRAAVIKASNQNAEDLTATKSKQTSAVVNNPRNVQKGKPASPKKYKFTPIVFDLHNKASEKANAGSMTEQVKQKSLVIIVNSGASGVLERKRLSSPEAAEATLDSSVAVTEVNATVEQSAAPKSDLTTESVPADTDSSSAKSECKITPVIKRQSSSTSHTPSNGSKKRRTSVDSR